MTDVLLPLPGTDEAKRRGCTCPSLANRLVRALGDLLALNAAIVHRKCPLHGDRE